jgi:dTDP-4-dehydrorhamnose reductase
MTKILLTGASGQLGKALQRITTSFHVEIPDRTAFDLSDPESIRKELQHYDFDVLVNAAAYTAVDRAEDDSAQAFRINAESVSEMAKACAQRGALMCHISTDYVFGKTHCTPILETAAAAPEGVYAASKLKGEELVRAECPNHIIIRTSWLYGPDGHNFLKTMLRLSESGNKVQVVVDQVGTPTFVGHLAQAIVEILAQYQKNKAGFPTGTYHFSNQGVASWYDFAHTIFELTGKKVDLQPVRSIVFPTKVIRPSYSVLDKQKIRDTFGLDIPHWRAGVHECLEIMKKSK